MWWLHSQYIDEVWDTFEMKASQRKYETSGDGISRSEIKGANNLNRCFVLQNLRITEKSGIIFLAYWYDENMILLFFAILKKLKNNHQKEDLYK